MKLRTVIFSLETDIDPHEDAMVWDGAVDEVRPADGRRVSKSWGIATAITNAATHDSDILANLDAAENEFVKRMLALHFLETAFPSIPAALAEEVASRLENATDKRLVPIARAVRFLWGP